MSNSDPTHCSSTLSPQQTKNTRINAIAEISGNEFFNAFCDNL